MASSTSTKGRNTTSKETANNKSSSSERRPPNSACRSHQLTCEPTNQEVSGERLAETRSQCPVRHNPSWRGFWLTPAEILAGQSDILYIDTQCLAAIS